MRQELKTPRKKTKKISFFYLFWTFRKQTIVLALSTFISASLNFFLFETTRSFIFCQYNETNEGFNFLFLLPQFLRKIFGENTIWNIKKFVLFGLCLVFVYGIFCYLNKLLGENLRVKSKNHIKNSLLDKFRQLPFEQRKFRQKEISELMQVDIVSISKYWERLWREVLIIVAFIYFGLYIKRLEGMNKKTIYFSLLWLFFISTISFVFSIVSFRNKKILKNLEEKENNLINKETNQSILIDSMGYSFEYKDKQLKKTKKNQRFELKFNRIESLFLNVPWRLLEVYPFVLFIIGLGKDSALYLFWVINLYAKDFFQIFRKYPEYTSSLVRINNFLSLPQKDDNLSGLIIAKKITSVVFKNVYFKYSDKENKVLENYDEDFTKKNFSYLLGESKDKSTILYFKQTKGERWILEDYNNRFTKKNINELSGENGTGKSTILYLLLGMLRPTSGQVLINCWGGKIYDLHRDLNLKHWREKIVAYAAHDTLIKEGSTGQKQLTNIEQVIAKKKNAQIFCFDEADNGLDKKSQEEFEEKLKVLLKSNKVVIYTTKI